MELKIALSQEELFKLIGEAFVEGALSYDRWRGQRDTLWDNVHEDKREYLTKISNEIQ